MNVSYSAITRGFYLESIHGKDVPSDVIDIPEGYWRGLIEAQSRGIEIRPDENGWPVAVLQEAL